MATLRTLPAAGDWLAELATLAPDARVLRLKEFVAEVKGLGGCGSLQTANGLPCRRPPKIGYPVCRKHGERAPQTVAKAERALAAARMPAIEWIMDALDQAAEETCDTCGYPRHGLKERKRLDALAFRLLDRTGFGPRSTIDVRAGQAESDLDLAQLSVEELAELEKLVEAMEEFQTRVRARIAASTARESLDDAIEGEVVRQALAPATPEPVDHTSEG